MSSHVPATAPELTALRARLYRPDPPADAVTAYLDAVRTSAPPVAAHASAVLARHRGRPVRAAAVAGLLVLAVAVLLGATRQASAADVTAPVTARLTPAADHLPLPAVPGRRLGALYGGAATTGRFSAHGARVIVSVLCAGDATIALRIAQEPATVLACTRGGAALAMLESTATLGDFAISVTPDSAVRWSLAVGVAPLAA